MKTPLYLIILISILSAVVNVADAIDKTVFNEYTDLLQPDTVGMSRAQIKEQFNRPVKTYEEEAMTVWQYEKLTDPNHPENGQNNICRVYFQDNNVHHVACNVQQ